MPIKVNVGKREIKSMIDQRIKAFMADIVEAVNRVGLEAVTISRQQHRYTDQTGNLTSSVGYVIVRDGKITIQDFELSDKGTDCVTGKNNGETFAKEIASQYATGTYLIIVAGMYYAAFVEAKGYDVLDSAEVYAKNEINNKIRDVIKVWQS